MSAVSDAGWLGIVETSSGELGVPAGTEEWMTFFRDPEGNLLGLSERRRPS